MLNYLSLWHRQRLPLLTTKGHACLYDVVYNYTLHYTTLHYTEVYTHTYKARARTHTRTHTTSHTHTHTRVRAKARKSALSQTYTDTHREITPFTVEFCQTSTNITWSKDSNINKTTTTKRITDPKHQSVTDWKKRETKHSPHAIITQLVPTPVITAAMPQAPATASNKSLITIPSTVITRQLCF